MNVELSDYGGSANISTTVGMWMLSTAKRFEFKPGKLPGLRFAHGLFANDAWVEPESLVSGTTHTVILGAERLAAESFSDGHHGNIAVALLIAHEMAHVYQLYSGLYETVHQEQEGMKFLELHADCLAGWFLGSDQAWSSDAFDVANRRVQAWGDYCVGDPAHHGLPYERSNALMTGWNTAQTASYFPDFAASSVKTIEQYMQIRRPAPNRCRQ